MKVLAQEVRNVQNPGLGAGLLWRFACGYVEAQRASEPVPMPLLFVVLPVLFHEQTEEFLRGTQKASGLRAFAAKFSDAKNSKQDVLLGINQRMLRLRELSIQSLRLGMATRLIHLEPNATVVPLTRTRAVAGIYNETRQLMRSADKLGSWCGNLTLHEIAATLKLSF